MKTKEVILCSKCNGKGKTSYDTCVDYHKREYDTIFEICNSCDGKGRLWKCVEVTYEKIVDREDIQ